MSSYKRGYSLEYLIKRLLENRGLPVIRFAGSKPADLFFKLGDERFVAECKKIAKKEESTIYLPENEVKKLFDLAELFEATPILIFSFYRQKPRVVELGDLKKSGRSFKIKKEDGIPLQRFIEGRLSDKLTKYEN